MEHNKAYQNIHTLQMSLYSLLVLCLPSFHKLGSLYQRVHFQSKHNIESTYKFKLQEKSDYRNRGKCYHKMIASFFKVHSATLRPKVIDRIYKIFNVPAFLSELHASKVEFSRIDPHKNCDCLTRILLDLVDKRTCLRNLFVRGNHTHFMNREFQKRYTIEVY